MPAFRSIVAPFVLGALLPWSALHAQQTPPPPTVGEGQSPRQDGTTRSGAPRPASAAASAGAVPKSEHDAKHPPGYRKGTSTPRESDSGSILGTPK